MPCQPCDAARNCADRSARVFSHEGECVRKFRIVTTFAGNLRPAMRRGAELCGPSCPSVYPRGRMRPQIPHLHNIRQKSPAGHATRHIYETAAPPEQGSRFVTVYVGSSIKCQLQHRTHWSPRSASGPVYSSHRSIRNRALHNAGPRPARNRNGSRRHRRPYRP